MSDKPKQFKGWLHVMCPFCAGGIVWDGGLERTDTCSNCGGAGEYYIHLKTGVKAEYPGGRLLGRVPTNELTWINNAILEAFISSNSINPKG